VTGTLDLLDLALRSGDVLRNRRAWFRARESSRL